MEPQSIFGTGVEKRSTAIKTRSMKGPWHNPNLFRQSENGDLYDFQLRFISFSLGASMLSWTSRELWRAHAYCVVSCQFLYSCDCHFWARAFWYLGHRQHILPGLAFLGHIKVHGEEGESWEGKEWQVFLQEMSEEDWLWWTSSWSRLLDGRSHSHRLVTHEMYVPMLQVWPLQGQRQVQDVRWHHGERWSSLGACQRIHWHFLQIESFPCGFGRLSQREGDGS